MCIFIMGRYSETFSASGRKLNVHKTSEDVQDVFWASYVRLIYVLCIFCLFIKLDLFQAVPVFLLFWGWNILALFLILYVRFIREVL